MASGAGASSSAGDGEGTSYAAFVVPIDDSTKEGSLQEAFAKYRKRKKVNMYQPSFVVLHCDCS